MYGSLRSQNCGLGTEESREIFNSQENWWPTRNSIQASPNTSKEDHYAWGQLAWCLRYYYYYYYYCYRHNYYNHHPHSLLHSSLAGYHHSKCLTDEALLIHCSVTGFLTMFHVLCITAFRFSIYRTGLRASSFKFPSNLFSIKPAVDSTSVII